EAWLAERIARFSECAEHKVRREIGGLAKYVDVRSFVTGIRIGGERAASELARAGFLGDLGAVETSVKILGQGGVPVAESVEALRGAAGIAYRAVGAELYADRSNGEKIDLMDLAALREERATAHAGALAAAD